LYNPNVFTSSGNEAKPPSFSGSALNICSFMFVSVSLTVSDRPLGTKMCIKRLPKSCFEVFTTMEAKGVVTSPKVVL